MSSQPHLQMINSSQATSSADFTPFPKLPKELRLKIWRFSLQRRRIICVHLNNQRGKTAEEAGEKPESTRNGERYFTVVEGTRLLSKLLRVNKESRDEALLFYRVHIPCRFTGPATACGTFHFNPEWDFLYIRAEWPASDTLAGFLYRVKTIYDPRHVGLLNLAVDGNGLNANDLYGLQPTDLDSEVRSAFIETLTQLREVWFVSTPRVGRQIVGFMSGLETSETIFNRSFPISTMIPTFERVPCDPRPISQDLEKTTGLTESKNMVQLWISILKKWCASRPSIDYRLLLAFDPTIGGDLISDRKSAATWLQKEDDQWNGRAPEDGFLKNKKVKWPVGAEAEKYRNEDLNKAVRPAFGFWLFPIEALGAIDTGKTFSNMKEHWPELALSTLH